jgi:hypothetical protein
MRPKSTFLPKAIFMTRLDRTPRPVSDRPATPFDTALEAWFWFIQAQDARNDGARFASGLGLVARPCEPSDILKILNTLYRARRLTRDHLLVLRHYGRRQMPPDPRRARELRAHILWKEALERLEPIWVRKGIVRARAVHSDHPNKFWAQHAVIYQGETHEILRRV